MAEPTEADKATAQRLIDRFLEHLDATEDRITYQSVDVTAIASALAAAREEGYMSGFATCYHEQKDATARAAIDAARKEPHERR